ncbi:MAG: helicase HerA domain-containing protein, partial [Promethearchaeota archaeon]
MSDIANPEAVGRLMGKTTTHSVQMLISNPKVERKNYFAIYGEKEDDGTKPTYILNISEMWTESKGMMAKLQVLGERPVKPFEMGSEVLLASEKQISQILGIYNLPSQSVSIGKLMGYPYDVNLLVKNFGRIFITGKSGSGKSYTMGVLCEEFLKKGIPVVIIDRHGEYGSLKVA